MSDYYYLACCAGNPMQVRVQKIEKGANVATPVTVTELYSDLPTASQMHFSPKVQFMAVGSAAGAFSDKRLRLFRRMNADQFTEIERSKIRYPNGAPDNGAIQDVRFSPNGKFLAAVSNTAGMQLMVFSIDREEDIFQAADSPLASSAYTVDWSADSKFLYVATAASPVLRVFSVSDAGIATEVTGRVNTQPANYPRYLRVSPDGDLLAIASPTSSAFIELYSVNKDTGALTKVANPTNADEQPAELSWQQTKRLLAAITSSVDANTYRRAGNSLFKEKPITMPATANASSIASAPDGRIAIALFHNTQRLWVFNYDEALETFSYNAGITSDIAETHQVVRFSNLIEDETTAGDAIQLYNSAIFDLLNDSVDLANLKVCILKGSAVFNASHTTFADAVGANEVYNAQWPQGGVSIPNVALERFAGQGVSLTFGEAKASYMGTDDLDFQCALIYDDSHPSNKPLAFVRMSENQTVKQFDEVRFNLISRIYLQFTPE